jgi:hypothetical protein
VKNVERIPNIGTYIVACMDDELLQLCKDKGIPAFYARSADIIGDRGNLGTAHGQKQQTIGADRCDLSTVYLRACGRAVYTSQLVLPPESGRTGFDALAPDRGAGQQLAAHKAADPDPRRR